jgi:hypothetical protein
MRDKYARKAVWHLYCNVIRFRAAFPKIVAMDILRENDNRDAIIILTRKGHLKL